LNDFSSILEELLKIMSGLRTLFAAEQAFLFLFGISLTGFGLALCLLGRKIFNLILFLVGGSFFGLLFFGLYAFYLGNARATTST
jgi:hypothetical protein